MKTRAGHLLGFLLHLLPLAASPSWAAAVYLDPQDGWTNTDPDAVLQWKRQGTNDVSFNVYFGTNPTPGATEFRGNQTDTIYCPGTLKTNQTYYWRIDTITNSGGALTNGPTWTFNVNPATPGTITRVNSMQERPSNYAMRDWKRTARDFSTLVTDVSLSGPYLPIASNETGKHNVTNAFWWIPSFVGFDDDAGALGGMVNVVSSRLAGLPMTNVGGINYVAAQASYFNIDKGYGVIFHSHSGGTVQSFWYQLIANIAFWQLVDVYPEEATNLVLQGNKWKGSGPSNTFTLAGMMQMSADKWHEVSLTVQTNVPANHVFPLSSAERTVDNADPTGVMVDGPWLTNPAVAGSWGTNYLQLDSANSGVTNRVTFTPNLTNAGSYEVFVRWPTATNRASDASLTVTYAGTSGPTSQTRRLNQRVNGGDWYSLGLYDFAQGTQGSIRINSTTTNGSAVNGSVAADAVRFAKQPVFTGYPDYDAYPGYAYFGMEFYTTTNPTTGPVGVIKPNNTGGTLMPHSAAGIAWLQLMAYKRLTNSPNRDEYFYDADHALSYLRTVPFNPSHDVLLPYGILAAARMNAEHGLNHDVGKFINWHFDEGDTNDVNEHTGVAVGFYGTNAAAVPVDGLVGKTGLQKVYPVNTFMSAGILAPVARYDQRYAKHIGKWLLNLASNARFFYSGTNGVAPTNQTSGDWCSSHDTNSALTYEFLANEGWMVTKAAEHSTDYSNLYEDFSSPGTDLQATNSTAPPAREFKDKKYLKFKTSAAGSSVIWAFNLPAGRMQDTNKPPHDFKIVGKVVAKNYKFSWDTSPGGLFTNTLLTLTNTNVMEVSKSFGSTGGAGTIYVKAESLENGAGEMWLDAMLVQTRNTDRAPFLAGGHMGHGGRTDLCLYQGSSAGYLGGIVETSNVTEILKVDLLATDFFHDAAYPTWLYYNPHLNTRTLRVNFGTNAVNIYDTVTHRFVTNNVSGEKFIDIPARSALILVGTPASGTIGYEGRKLKVDNVVVDHRYPVETRLFYDGFESGSFTLGSWSNTTSTAVNSTAAYSSTRGAKMSFAGSITKFVDTRGFNGIQVKYRRATTGYSGTNALIVEWSTNGTTWSNLATVPSGTYAQGPQTNSCAEGASDNAGFRVRFKSAGTNTAQYSYVDDVEITGKSMN